MVNFTIPKTREEVLSIYNLPVLHLRQQFRYSRVGITVGAGISRPLNYPMWDELVSEIASTSPFDRNLLSVLPDSSITTNTQRLFEYFHVCVPRKPDESERLYSERVANFWKKNLSKCLYRNNLGAVKEENLKKHPYLDSMLPIIEKSNVVVNFNFDDSIEHALELRNKSRQIGQRKTRPSETRWDLGAPVRNDIPTVFHLNGYLAYREHEYSSDNIVFAEDSFLKRLTMGKIGDDSILLSEYINNTYIHVGLSLKDEVLKALLQRSWRAAPANIHYQIHYLRDGLDKDAQNSIAEANFRVLNLYTLFLGDEGTKSLFELINMPDDQFQDIAMRIGRNLKYTFYITGAVGSGKTTIVNHFKNFWAMDEWIDPSPEVVSKPFDKLSSDEKRDADEWIGNQFGQKNLRLLTSNESVAMIDRCPLDPLTFETNNYSDRAKTLQKQLSPGVSNYKLEKGVVFVLEAEPYELRVRLIRKWKFWEETTIKKLINAIRDFYMDRPVYVDTKGQGPEDVVRILTRKIFFDDYTPSDLDAMLIEATMK